MDSFESLPCGCITEEQTGKHSLCKHLENLVFWSYNVQEKRGSMKKLTLENWQELQPYIALADYHEYNSNTMTMLMWTSMYEVYFETYPNYAIAYTCMPHREPRRQNVFPCKSCCTAVFRRMVSCRHSHTGP